MNTHIHICMHVCMYVCMYLTSDFSLDFVVIFQSDFLCNFQKRQSVPLIKNNPVLEMNNNHQNQSPRR